MDILTNLLIQDILSIGIGTKCYWKNHISRVHTCEIISLPFEDMYTGLVIYERLVEPWSNFQIQGINKLEFGLLGVDLY